MQNTTKLGALLLTSVFLSSPALAATLTNFTLIPQGVAFTRDTVANSGWSPIGFTLTGSTSNPFLNNADKSVSLGYGSYYMTVFGGVFATPVGPGYTFRFLLDNTTTYSQVVTLPDNLTAGQIFGSFALPDGDTVQLSTTGLFADRVRNSADGAGLAPDGNDDPLWLLTYTSGSTDNSAVPEPSSIALGLCGLAVIAWRRHQK